MIGEDANEREDKYRCEYFEKSADLTQDHHIPRAAPGGTRSGFGEIGMDPGKMRTDSRKMWREPRQMRRSLGKMWTVVRKMRRDLRKMRRGSGKIRMELGNTLAHVD